jgi:hypothetical protein
MGNLMGEQPEEHEFSTEQSDALDVLSHEGAFDEGEFIAAIINTLCTGVHEANRKWWTNLETGEYPIERNIGELLCLVHSEISEAMEGARKNLMDDKIPTRPMLEVELADAVIRIFDIAAGFGLDLGGAYVEKNAFNAVRADHTLEARKAEGGKKF